MPQCNKSGYIHLNCFTYISVSIWGAIFCTVKMFPLTTNPSMSN